MLRSLPPGSVLRQSCVRARAAMATNATKRLSIDIASDTVCPWCFVGKRRLEAAMSQMANRGVEFEVKWFPYQLDSNAPIEGRNKMEMYNEKFGAARVAQIVPQMTKTFADLGLTYSLGGLTGNTLDSHRLIHWAGQVGGAQAQNAVVEELFKNYFTEEKFINDRAVLLAAAEKAGLQGAAEYLADPNNGTAEVKAMIAGTRAQGISGVPNFTIDKKYTLSGAQDPATFVQVFNKALEEQA